METELIGLLILSIICGVLITIVQSHQIRSQSKQIDRLIDRLMARSYTEYVSMQPETETPQEPRREPLSWYDDAEIEDTK